MSKILSKIKELLERKICGKKEHNRLRPTCGYKAAAHVVVDLQCWVL